MKLANALGILIDMWQAVQTALLPTICAILAKPLLALYPRSVSQIFMHNVWRLMGEGMDEGNYELKRSLITENAQGVVLDIGAGHGHTARYLDHARVTKYVALEPNALMHPEIRKRANEHGWSEEDGSLVILSYGAEQAPLILSALSLSGEPPVDVMVSIMALCSVPPSSPPDASLRNLVTLLLKPGGQFVFYEHVRSYRADVAWWQRFWTPVWQILFDGCRLDRPSHELVRALKGLDGETSIWDDWELRDQEGDIEENVFWHQIGRFTKVHEAGDGQRLASCDMEIS
ncbi:hypothetical protein PUNSTDRAFT_134811 [Punctularia strigosozonata HHB-11173 SS5]|uniref:uncharacterized protein n=1 Tax=Punctularia strigosozonata (strain HHB-11173) TaxID=741275 RepID=UPI000441859B|nr:uncharacterized protein PUNSTDRAFT_134811 [Punctularia strigosozonata HHB-11173 SS5]EIN08429.1 hypothetical protein PUNSTDRAFT_134811 [Punctularia strigosozonata HHB-11173 SS5]